MRTSGHHGTRRCARRTLRTIRLQGGPTAVHPTLSAPLPIALKIT